MVSVYDTFAEINTFFGLRLILTDSLKPWLLKNSIYASTSYIASAYLIYSQCLIHTAIAINRAWCAFMVTTHKKDMEKIGKSLIWTLPFWGALFVAFRFVSPEAIYVVKLDGELAPKYLDPRVAQYHSISSPIVIFSTSLISFVLEVATIFRYRYLIKNMTSLSLSLVRDITLFIQALFILVIQLLFVSYYCATLISTIKGIPELQQFALLFYPWFNDFLSLCNPVVLLIVCKSIRTDYLYFYGIATDNRMLFVKIGPSTVNGT